MNPIILNLKAKPKVYDSVASNTIDLTESRLWKQFCRYEPKPERRYTLLTELRRVWVTLTEQQRVRFFNAKNIDKAFTWAHSPQGDAYWMDWNDHLHECKKAAI